MSYLWSNGETTQSITVAEGSYSVTVSSAEGCNDDASHTVTLLPAVTASIEGPTTVCPGNTVILTAYPEGMSYLWSTGETSQSITVSQTEPTITYTVTVTSNEGCQDNATHILSLSEGLEAWITGPISVCPDNTVTLTAYPAGMSYLWSNGETTQSITVSNGSYSVTVTSADGCNGDASHTVTLLPAVTASIEGPTTVCPDNTVTLTAYPAGMSYLWNNGETTQSITVSDGSYSVTVTSADGCDDDASHTVTLLPAVTASIEGPTTVCPDNSVTLTAYPAGMSYLWSNGETTQSITVSNGSYSVTVTSADGCNDDASYTVTLLPTVTASIEGPTTVCPDNTVTLTAYPEGMSYLWNTGETTQSITVSEGNYSVTVTSADGCDGEASHTVTLLPAVTASIEGPTTVCPDNTVTLTAYPAGMSYLWSTGETTQSITISDGSYSVTVTSADGCDDNASHTVTLLPAVTASIEGPMTVCPDNTVTLTAYPDGMNYLWSTGETTQSITVSEGSYSVTVTSADGCNGDASHTVTLLPAVTASIEGPTTVCPGNTVILTAYPEGMSYLWSTGETSQSITVSQTEPTATYSVTVTSDEGCSDNASHELSLSEELEAWIVGPSSVCADTEVTLEAKPDGMASYLWSTGETTQSITVSLTEPTATYSVMVTSFEGCDGNASHTVTLLPAVTASIEGPTTVCPDNSVTLTAYPDDMSYLWSTGETTQSITVSLTEPTATYSVTVTSEEGCYDNASHTVTLLPAVTASIEGPTTVCPGNSVTLTAYPEGMSYLWSNGEATQSITVSLTEPTASYSVTVTSDEGCYDNASHELSLSEEPEAWIVGPSSVCAGTTVTLEAKPDGMASYLWSTGETTQSITVSLTEPTATYSVTVTSFEGCQGNASHELSLSEELEVWIVGPASVCPDSEVTLEAKPDGMESYLWSTGETTQSISVSLTEPTATYSVTVTSDEGCQGNASHDLSLSEELEAWIVGPSSVCAGTAVTLEAKPDGMASYLWSTGETSQTISVLLTEPTATYSVTVTSFEGCDGNASHTVTLLPAVTATIEGPMMVCPGNSVTLTAHPDGMSYLWSNGETTQSITVSLTEPTATYSVTVTSDEGCLDNASHELSLSEEPEAWIAGPSSVCAGTTVTLEAKPDGMASYSWNTGETSQSITVTLTEPTATYSVTVTSLEGCQDDASHELSLSEELEVWIVGPTTVCPDSEVTLEAKPDGMESYLWSTGETTQSISVSLTEPTATYSVTVTSFEGCQGNASHDLSLSEELEAWIVGPSSVCAGTTVTLEAKPDGMASYLWSTGETTQSISVLLTEPTATYSVTVTSFDGCDGNASHTVTLLPAVTASIEGPATTCPDNTVTLTAYPDGMNYLWNTGETTQSISVSQTEPVATYSVTVSSDEGCYDDAYHELSLLEELEVWIVGPSSVCAGTAVTLEAKPDGMASYLWSTGETTQTISVSLTEPTATYSVTVTSFEGCQGNASHDLFLSEELEAWIVGPTLVCAGTTVTLEAKPDGMASYLWSTGETTQSISVSLTEPTATYSVTVTSFEGCQGNASHIVTVQTPPIANAGDDIEVAYGASATLSAANAGAGAEYHWEPEEYIDGDPNQQTVTTIPLTEEHTFTLTVNIGECEDTDVVTVSVGDELMASVTAKPETVCPNEAAVLEVTPVGGSGAYTYAWEPASMIDGDNTQRIVTTVGLTTDQTYTVTVFDNDKTIHREVVVRVFPAIDAYISGDTEVCPEESVTLTAYPDGMRYQWSTGETEQSITVTPEDPITEYSVIVTSDNDCQEEVSFEVTVNPLPIVDAGEEQHIPYNTQATLTAADAGPGATYHWEPEDLIDSDPYQQTVTTVRLTEEATFSVLVTLNGCENDSEVTVNVGNQLEVTAEANPEGGVCYGENAVLTAFANEGTGTYTYEWEPAGMIVGDNTQATVTTAAITSEQTFTVTVFDGNETKTAEVMVEVTGESTFDAVTMMACDGYEWHGQHFNSDGDYIFVYSNENGCFSVDTLHLSIVTPRLAIVGYSDVYYSSDLWHGIYNYYVVDSTGIDLGSIEWECSNPDWILLEGESMQCMLIATTKGTATLTAHPTTLAGCDDMLSIVITATEFPDDDVHEISMFPNPADVDVTVKAHNLLKVSVISLWGQHIMDIPPEHNDSTTIPIEGLSAGMYVVEIITEKGTYFERLIISQ